MFGGVLLFHPLWVVSSALAGLASGFGMGPGVSLPLWTAVTVFTFQSAPLWVGDSIGPVLLVVGCDAIKCGYRGCDLCVSFRPVSTSSLNPLLGV